MTIFTSSKLHRGFFLSALSSGLALLTIAGQAALSQGTPTLIVLRPGATRTKPSTDGSLPALQRSDISEIKIGGKQAQIVGWTPLLKGTKTLQLVVLLDAHERIGVDHQFDDIRDFFKSLPANVEIAVGSLRQGRAEIDQPFTADRAVAGRALRLKSLLDVNNPENENGDPYYCLQYLANHWPDPSPDALRAVLIITDGFSTHSRSGFQEAGNQTIDTASDALIRGGIVPYSLFYSDIETPGIRPLGGQVQLDELSEKSIGQAFYYPGITTTRFAPLLYRFYSMLSSEVVVGVSIPGSGLKTVDVKPSSKDVKIVAPDKVTIGNAFPNK